MALLSQVLWHCGGCRTQTLEHQFSFCLWSIGGCAVGRRRWIGSTSRAMLLCWFLSVGTLSSIPAISSLKKHRETCLLRPKSWWEVIRAVERCIWGDGKKIKPLFNKVETDRRWFFWFLWFCFCMEKWRSTNLRNCNIFPSYMYV